MMDNYQIADCFSLLAKLSDIHGENSFKAKSYSIAAFTIEKLTVPLSELPPEKIASIKGIGDSTAKKINELLTTGQLPALISLIEKTPVGVMEMLNIKGIGPKKIATIWKEMEIESVGELLYACQENRLKLFKGFGEKTQQNVIETIEYYLNSKGSFLYSQVAALQPGIHAFLNSLFAHESVAFTGAFIRQMEIVHELEIVVDQPMTTIQPALAGVADFELVEQMTDQVLYRTSAGLKFRIHSTDIKAFAQRAFLQSCSEEFATAFTTRFPQLDYSACKNEKDIFEQAGLHFIPSYQRETAAILDKAMAAPLDQVVHVADIRGIIHSHSNWSDGSNTIEEMALQCITKGYEYLVISDHSKSAFYANGLSIDRIREQHLYIDELNKRLAPFKIFKSIESDILNDGSLDYPDEILASFDLVIASVHSNLKMTEEKAMMRLLTAIANPYTTILGHLTGRLLLSRKGYPVDHAQIISACAAHGVVIELNAHPRRLDIDWRHITAATEQHVLISINPDAHSPEGFDDIMYGTLVAQKAGLTKSNNLSSFSLEELETYLAARKNQRVN